MKLPNLDAETWRQIGKATGAAFAAYLGYRAYKSSQARKRHAERLKPLIEQFIASGEKDTNVANEIRALTMHTLNPHLQPFSGVFLLFSSFLGENIARLVMASPQGRTNETSFARFEQTNRLLAQYLHYPPDHPRAVEAIERTNHIHSKFPAIFEKYRPDMVYIWSQFGPLAGKRISERIRARRQLSSEELQAIWLLSRITVEKMGCTAPERWEEIEKFAYKFEETTMPQTKSSLRFAEIMLSFFDHVKPTPVPRFLTYIFCEGIFSPPMKHAAGLDHPSIGTKIGAFLVFDVLMNAVDFWQYYFNFTGEQHSFPGEMGEDGLVGRPTFQGEELASARESDFHERFKILDVNDKYEAGARLAF